EPGARLSRWRRDSGRPEIAHLVLQSLLARSPRSMSRSRATLTRKRGTSMKAASSTGVRDFSGGRLRLGRSTVATGLLPTMGLPRLSFTLAPTFARVESDERRVRTQRFSPSGQVLARLRGRVRARRGSLK